MWGVWFGGHLSPTEMGTERIMTRERGGRRESVRLSRARGMKSLSNKQTKGGSAIQAGAILWGPYLKEWLGWTANIQVWSWINAVLLPELERLTSADYAPGICSSSRAPSAKVPSKLMPHSRCSTSICWKNGQIVTPELCLFFGGWEVQPLENGHATFKNTDHPFEDIHSKFLSFIGFYSQPSRWPLMIPSCWNSCHV